METQLLQAISIASGGAQNGQNADLVQQALVFIEQVKANTQEVWSAGWNIFASRNLETRKPIHDHQQRLFGLSLVTDFLDHKISETQEPSKAISFLHSEAISHFEEEYISGNGEDGAGFVKNKFAQFLSALIIQTYSLAPPFTIINDLIARIQVQSSTSNSNEINPVAADMLLRTLHEVSVNLGSDTILRAMHSRERLQRDSHIRDEIRLHQAANIAEVAWKIAQEGHTKVQHLKTQAANVADQERSLLQSIDLTCDAVKIIGDYVSWIDISLVVSPETMALLFSLLQQDIASIRCAATDALTEIVSKGMQGPDKLSLLQALNLTSVIANLEKTSRAQTDSDDAIDEKVTLREHLAKLANNVAVDLAHIVEDRQIAASIRKEADDLLLTQMQSILDFLRDDYDEIAEAVMPCIGITITLYRRLRRQEGNTPERQSPLSILSPEKVEFLSSLMTVLLIKMKFSDDSEWKGAHDEAEDDDDDEETAKFLQLRKQLQQHATAIAGIDEQLFTQPTILLIMETLEACDVSSSTNLSWQQAELGLFAIYFCGEVIASGGQASKNALSATSFVILPPGLPKAVRNKPPEGFFLTLSLNSLGEVVQRFFQSRVSSFQHPAVQMQYFECAIRYSAFFAIRPDMLGEALAPFLDWRGIHNERQAVRTRCNYLFLRFIKDTREQIQIQYIQGILENISDLLVIDATVPSVSEGEDPLEMALKSSTVFDGQLDLFQACGVLVYMLRSNPESQLSVLRALIEPLSSQLQSAIQDHSRNRTDLNVVLQVHHLFFALASLAKGFPEISSSNGSLTLPWMNHFKNIIEQFLSALETGTLRDFKIIRDAARGAFSRIINTTGVAALPYVPALLQSLLPRINESELIDFFGFLGLITAKYKSDIVSVIDEIFTPLLERTFYFLNGNIAGTDDVIRRDHSIRAYLTFISTLIGAGLDDILRSERNRGKLEVLLQSLVFYSSSVQPTIVRNAAIIFSRLVNTWLESLKPEANVGTATNNSLNPPRSALPGFEQFVYKTLVPLIFEVPSRQSFDLDDAQSQIALTEMCNIAKAIHQKRGQEFIDYLQTSYLPMINCPQNQIQDLLIGLQKNEPKIFKKSLESLCRASKERTT